MFKINVSDKSGKTYKLELETEELFGKELHDKVQGKEILPALEGYELEITGASDTAGFSSHEKAQGPELRRLLLTYGKSLHKRARREGKKKVSNPKPNGLRMRRTVRGKVISPAIMQINLKVLKTGAKPLSEIFPDQAKGKEKKENRAMKRKKAREAPKSEKKEEVTEEKKE